MSESVSRLPGAIRAPSVAGSFYPADPTLLRALVARLLQDADRDDARTGPAVPVAAEDSTGDLPLGLLVPHAGLEYSGVIAAAGWRRLRGSVPEGSGIPGPMTVVILGTNHVAAWLDGIGAWERGAWRTPAGDLEVDEELAAAIVGLGNRFSIDRDAHRGEHSIEVQLPLLRMVAPSARIVPLAVATGTGPDAIEAGTALGTLLAGRIALGERVVLAISSDMAHYPPHDACARVTRMLLPAILALDPVELAAREHGVRVGGAPVACGMCGIAPAVLGLAALRALGADRAVPLAAATSADAGGPTGRTVGYLAVAFEGPR